MVVVVVAIPALALSSGGCYTRIGIEQWCVCRNGSDAAYTKLAVRRGGCYTRSGIEQWGGCYTRIGIEQWCVCRQAVTLPMPMRQ